MVKKILFVLIMLFASLFVAAENMTVEDSYIYDYVSEDTTISFIDKVDTDEKTVMTFLLNSTPGEFEINAALGTKSIQEVKFFENFQNEIVLEFNKVFSGEKDFLLMIYREDALIVFMTNEGLVVKNNVVLSPSINSIIVNEDIMQIVLDIDTNLNVSNSSLSLISSNGKVYNSYITKDLENGLVSYSFTPKENAIYNFLNINVQGYVRNLNGSIGSFNFATVKSMVEEQTSEGLQLTFDNSGAQLDVNIYTTENELVYSSQTTNNLLLIPNNVIFTNELNGPYKVIAVEGVDSYEFITKEYVFGDFDNETQEVIVTENITVKETKTTSTSGASKLDGINETQNITEQIITQENNSQINTTELTSDLIEDGEKGIEKLVNETSDLSNTLTGFSIKGLSTKVNVQNLIILAVVGFIFAILLFVYVKQRRDAYYYEM